MVVVEENWVKFLLLLVVRVFELSYLKYSPSGILK